MGKFASHLGKARQVLVVRYNDGYLISDNYMIRRVTAGALAAALARRPELLAEVLTGKGDAYRYEAGTGMVFAVPASLTQTYERICTPYEGRVTRVAFVDEKRTLQAILRRDLKAVVWVNLQLLEAAGTAIGTTIEMAGERDPIRFGPCLITPAFPDHHDALAAAAGLRGSLPTPQAR